MWDIFISHAWEDKEAVARPLAEGLREAGLAVWYDEFALRLGDSLRRSINRGLKESRYGLVILSPAFFRREWPQKELDGLAARELQGGKVVLPVWHNVTHEDVLQFSAPLADKLAVSTQRGLDSVIQQVLAVVQPHTEAAPPSDLAPPHAEDESLAQAIAEYQDILAPFLLLPELSAAQRSLLERTRRRLGLSWEHAQQIERSLGNAHPPSSSDPSVQPPEKTIETTQSFRNPRMILGGIALLILLIVGASLYNVLPAGFFAGCALINPTSTVTPAPTNAPAALAAPTPTPTRTPVPPTPTPGTARAWTDPTTGMEFVWVAGGCFQMGCVSGSDECDSDEKPVHEVCVEGFYMGKYEVTNAQYRQWKREHDSGDYQDHSLNNDEQPVVRVSWEEAVEFAQWLTDQSGGKYTFRLPTEAEWEYAARAGTTTARFWGDDPDEACAYANVGDLVAKENFPNWDWETWDVHNCDDGYAVSAPVGSFRPNQFELYDMLGNVWEWCADTYHDSYADAPADGSFRGSLDDEKAKMVRGGGWGSSPSGVRSASRLDSPESRDLGLGVRLARGR